MIWSDSEEILAGWGGGVGGEGRGIKLCIFTFTATAVDKLKITNGRVALASYCFYRPLGVNIGL